MKPKDGGPAFPVKVENVEEYPRNSVPREIEHTGMTLRQWLAGMAMQAYLQWGDNAFEAQGKCASMAYRMADAMLAYEESESNG